MEFKSFPKIPRLYESDIIITEKIDGTNSGICIGEDGYIHAQSRNKIITPESDNYGFAGWVNSNKEELKLLGPGYHFGEWWGVGINRGYDVYKRVFSLFNTTRWKLNPIPLCCNVVPILYEGPYSGRAIEEAIQNLGDGGSIASPGYMKPEGIVIYHVRSAHMYKVPFGKC